MPRNILKYLVLPLVYSHPTYAEEPYKSLDLTITHPHVAGEQLEVEKTESTPSPNKALTSASFQAEKPKTTESTKQNLLDLINNIVNKQQIDLDTLCTKTNLNNDQKTAAAVKMWLKGNDQRITFADSLYNASEQTNTPLQDLLIRAFLETDLSNDNKKGAPSHFKFSDQSWLSLIQRHNVQLNLEQDSDEERLKLKSDYKTNALIKAYQTQEELKTLGHYIQNSARQITVTDHIILHMLGAPLARIFFKLDEAKSSVVLANLKNNTFAEAIQLNPMFFYNKDKLALTASQAYAQFEQKVMAKRNLLKKIQNKYAENCTENEIVTSQTIKDQEQPKAAVPTHQN